MQSFAASTAQGQGEATSVVLKKVTYSDVHLDALIEGQSARPEGHRIAEVTDGTSKTLAIGERNVAFRIG